MMQHIKKFVANESGATAIEYALIASLVAIAIIGALNTLAGKLSNTFGDVGNNLK
jgi:pilus assembly protein Flp/PilA